MTACNRLVILTTADHLPDESCDILALTLPAMAMLKAKGRCFLVLEDIYPHEHVYQNTNEFSTHVASWLKDCDKLCADHLNVQQAFSATGFWILHRLSDLNYIQCIIDRLDSSYQYIELWSDSDVSSPPLPKVDFSSLNMPSFGVGLGHVLWFMRAGLPKLVIHNTASLQTKQHSKQVVGGEPWWSLLKRLPDILVRRAKLVRNRFTNALHKNIGQVWVVQQGYDVDILDSANPQWEFLRIRSNEIKMANSATIDRVVELDTLIATKAETFFNQHFPRYTVWLNTWFDQYYQQVVLKIKHYELALEMRMKESKPTALLYSIGAEDVLEEVLCRVANRLSIPVFFFKHGGIAEHFLPPSILDPYLELNTTLQRTQFIHSQVEESNYSSLLSVNAVVSGPLSRTKLQYTRSQQKKNILYSVGPPAHYSFKELRKTISDNDRFTFMNDLLDSCVQHKLSVSVKVHPAEWRVAWDCVRILNTGISDSQYKAKLIAGGAIERIFNQFGLLVLDMISTRVLSMAIGIDIPIILYLPEGSPVNKHYFSDLDRRVYIVRNRQDLNDILLTYQRQGLPSRYDHDFVKKYLGCFDPNTAIQCVNNQIFNSERENIC